MTTLHAGKCPVQIFPSRAEMGERASADAAEAVRALLSVQDEVNIIFAAAPSQNEILSALAQENLDWSRVNALHMDEYIGLPKGDSRLFAAFLQDAIFSRVPFKSVHKIDGSGDSSTEIARYSQLLHRYPCDILLMGIGENGHIAFNDPPVADFNDAAAIKVVELEERCRQQQVNDGCFQSLTDVPTHAFTVTIPALMSAGRIFCVVPALSKAEAVRDAVEGDITTACPASILQTKGNATLYLDSDSASLLGKRGAL